MSSIGVPPLQRHPLASEQHTRCASAKKTRYEDRPPCPRSAEERARTQRAARVRSRLPSKWSASTRSTTSRGSRTSRRRPFRASSTSRRSCARKRARASPRSSSASASRRIRRRAALAFRRSFLIGLIYDNPNAPYVINIQEGALGALRRVGYELVVHPCDRHSAGIPDRHPPAHQRARSWTA